MGLTKQASLNVDAICGQALYYLQAPVSDDKHVAPNGLTDAKRELYKLTGQ